MALELALEVLNPTLGTLESVRVRVTLTNTGYEAVVVPGSADTTDALDVRAYESPHAPDEDAGWHANYRIRHLMMISDRPDFTGPSLETLAPGGSIVWELDLASMQYPLALGEHWLEAFYRYEPIGLELRSARVAVSVEESRTLSVAVTRDDCVLDGIMVLLKADGTDGIEWVSRLHNAGRPLAAWWSARLDAGQTGTPVLAAYNAFHRDDVFDHFFERWLVDVSPHEARCQRIDQTLGVRERRISRLSAAGHVPRAAYWDGADGLYLLSSAHGGSLHCRRLTPGDSESVFVHGSSFHLGTPGEVVVDRRHIHVVVQGRRLAYERLDHAGNVVLRRELPRSRMEPCAVRYDVDRARVLSVFRDGPSGRFFRFVVFDPTTGETLERERTFALRGQTAVEIAFDVDLSGRFHYLVGTSAHRLYYVRDEAGPLLLSSGEQRFLPVVHAPRRLYLGYYETRFGWRFRQYTSHVPGIRPLPHQPRPPARDGDGRESLLGMTTMDLGQPPDPLTLTGELGVTAEDLPEWTDDPGARPTLIGDPPEPGSDD